MNEFATVRPGFAQVLLAMMGWVVAAAGWGRAELPKSLADPTAWRTTEFLASLTETESGFKSPVSARWWKDAPPILDLQPQFVSVRFVNEQPDSISYVILDAGSYFGYQNRNISGSVDRARLEFDAEFNRRLTVLRAGLRAASGGKEKELTLGGKNGLGWPVRIYSCGSVVVRLMAVDHQLLLLDIFPSMEESLSLRCAAWMTLKRRRPEEFLGWLKKEGLPLEGDREVQGIPLLPQGNRGYCGAAIMAMTARYLGLQAGPEEMAVLAGFQYGETKSPDIRDLCNGIARAAGVNIRRAGKFDFTQARVSIDAGLPVVVFRRWASERDYVHTLYATRLRQGDAQAALPPANMEDRKSWPDKNAPAHASIVHGYNEKRREIIFTESWAVAARSRRMRVEELEATSYFAVFFVP